ncbi:PfkB family carbohydrate kinase [Lactobacillus sp. ESL0701]|uniref:PfkB family carbohydrate kinase n=1 Tax=Lactobacillus sp. ESL0701 TaxID=2983217 RepID=UPI0023F939EC|nr:PfkB family carbohydrate kinase [Lactobacillus sp. ESL0701]MDF7671841.1 PfkB family carbohydrate kinase [Lactobacillus sp. ESL0701]
MKAERKLLLVEDYSAIGGISLATAISVMSALGIKYGSLPMQILSTQTEGFGKPQKVDLADFSMQALAHWQQIPDLNFATLLTGYLGSQRTCQLLIENIRKGKFKQIIVDPVLGDNGKLYPELTPKDVAMMKELVATATVITPNLTELGLLSGYEQKLTATASDADLARAIKTVISQSNPKLQVVVTGVRRGEQIGCCYLKQGQLHYCGQEYFAGHFYGAGDLFAASLAGLFNLGFTLPKAIELATTATHLAIAANKTSKQEELRYGMDISPALAYLIKQTIPK